MARTNQKWVRVYMDGYDFSCMSRAIGPLTQEHEFGEFTAFCDAIKNGMNNRGTVGVGNLDIVFDNTATTGSHTIASSISAYRDVMVAIGFQAVPAEGDPVFVAQCQQAGYQAVPDEAIVTATVPFAPTSYSADQVAYDKAWGHLIHAHGAETAANTSDSSDHDSGSQTAKGGFMMYQITAGDGTATISIEDSDTESNGDYSELLTSGELDCSSVQSGVVALGITDTVERYTRWQISLNSATTVTFALAFVRG